MSSAAPPVTIRPVRPEDKPAFVAGLAALSDESRYRRFFAYKKQLSQSELAYLTEVDGEHHVALVAITDAEQHGVGVARFVRLRDEPEVAEAAVTVVDAYQGLGIGRRLLSALADEAVRRGVRWFRCEVLLSNAPMRALADSLSPEVRARPAEPQVQILDIPLTEQARAELRTPPTEAVAAPRAEPPAAGPLRRLLAAVASGLLEFTPARGRVRLRAPRRPGGS